MSRRWLIRSVFMLPVLLCVMGWGWSTTRDSWIQYGWISRNGAMRTVNGGTRWGVVYIESGSPYSMIVGWHIASLANPPRRFLPSDNRGMLGFSFHSDSLGWDWAVPYWFLILAIGVLLILAWRKTRPKQPGGAFPVEAKTKAEGKQDVAGSVSVTYP